MNCKDFAHLFFRHWQSLADKAGVPLSKFVIELVENAIIEESDFKPRGELVKEIGKLRTENKELWDDMNQKKPFENSEST